MGYLYFINFQTFKLYRLSDFINIPTFLLINREFHLLPIVK
jgi:hypothetical protein